LDGNVALFMGSSETKTEPSRMRLESDFPGS